MRTWFLKKTYIGSKIVGTSVELGLADSSDANSFPHFRSYTHHPPNKPRLEPFWAAGFAFRAPLDPRPSTVDPRSFTLDSGPCLDLGFWTLYPGALTLEAGLAEPCYDVGFTFALPHHPRITVRTRISRCARTAACPALLHNTAACVTSVLCLLCAS